MRLTHHEWLMLARAGGFVGSMARDREVRAIAERLGPDGETAALEGVDPVLGSPRHELVRALRALVAHVNRIEHDKITNPLVTNDLLTALVKAEKVLEACKIRIDRGKGSKDRYVLFGKSFATALRTHIAAHPKNRWLFQTRRNTKFPPRRIRQIVKQYARLAGVQATPHTFRHQAITWLTRHSGLADAELQLITGHARRETLGIYQHVALDGQLEDRYQEAMRKIGL